MGLGKKKMLSQGASAFVPTDNFGIVTYGGTGNTQSTNSLSSQSGTINFQPDLIWFKNRTGAYPHQIYNSIRGVTKFLNPGVAAGIGSYTGTGAEFDTSSAYGGSGGDLKSFNSNGFTIGAPVFGSVNEVGFNHVAWCFKGGGAATDITSSSTGVSAASRSANPDAGFSIVTYTMSSTIIAIPHGLNSAPKMAIVKRTDSSSSWFVFNTVASGKGRGFLNTTGAFDNSGVPTFGATDFTFQDSDPFSTGSVVVYFFADVAGYQKIGSYSSDGNNKTIDVGFQPRWVLIKNYSSAGNYWLILDSSRTTGTNGKNRIYVNTAQAEDTSIDVSFNATDFTLLTSNGDVNGSGKSYIYLAIA